MSLRPVAPREAHRFPHRRITLKLCRARRAYPCNIEGHPPEGHTARIAAGALYIRVAIRPARRAPDRWRTVRLCPACAVALGLAVQ